MYFDLIDDVKAVSCPGGVGPGQVTSCDLCEFCFEGHDRFARLDPACPNDRARDTVQRISDRCLSVFWTSLPRRDLSPRIRPHHRFANRHTRAKRTRPTLSSPSFFALPSRLPVQILPRCLTALATTISYAIVLPQDPTQDTTQARTHITTLAGTPSL